MNSVFLDTSAIVALANSRDQVYQQAQAIWTRLNHSKLKIVTTSLVLIEVGDTLSHVKFRESAVVMRDRIRTASRIEVIQVTSRHEELAWRLFEDRGDKEWGMTDCVSIVVMQELAIQTVFSFDRHFQQAGFKLADSGPSHN